MRNRRAASVYRRKEKMTMSETHDNTADRTPAAARIFPGGTGPTFPCPDSPWPFGISPGELHGTLFRQGIANPDARRDRTGTMRRGIAGLAERGLISPIESELLNRIVVAVISKGDVRDTHRTILELHRRITDDRKASPVALTISGIAVDSISTQLTAEEGSSLVRGVASADVEGAIGGAGVGALGGPWGAVLGGLIGGVASSIAAHLDARATAAEG
jgi:hypothetical protein